MKTREIELGKSYTDGKGNVRRVIAEGPEYTHYWGQVDRDCVRYRVVERTSGLLVGAERNTTRNSFASWARAEVTEGEEVPGS